MQIPVITRFNPTVNGPLHLGHVYSILVNQAHAAQHPNGQFIVRFDDDQVIWNDTLDWRQIATYRQQMRADIEWLGIPVHGWFSQRDMHYHALKLLTLRCHEAGIPVPTDANCERYFPDYHGTSIQMYPYTPYKTAIKVIMDSMLGVSLLIRGEDLLGEHSLYCYFCDIFELYSPAHIYLPRLRVGPNNAEISKTLGNLTLANLRQQGYSPSQVFDLLADACLVMPGTPWLVEHIKSAPHLRREIMEPEP